jgi:hypothetical protein
VRESDPSSGPSKVSGAVAMVSGPTRSVIGR